MGFLHHITKAISHAAKTVEHIATHPQDTVKTVEKGVEGVAHGVKDLAQGHGMTGLGEIVGGAKKVLDPDHLVGASHQLARPITNPINKALAQGIKGATGHNVLGSHPLNTVGTVVAGVVTAGAGSALMAGASIGEAIAAGVGAAEGLAGAGVSAVGTGLSTVGLDAAGATVSGWGGALSAAAASNAFTSGAVQATTGGLNELGDWTASNGGSVFNGGYGATGLHGGVGIGTATGGQQAGLQGSFAAASNAASASQLAGSNGLVTGFGDAVAGITNPYSLSPSLDAQTQFAQAASGHMGTDGVGLYGESAKGVVDNSSGALGSFQGANYTASEQFRNSQNLNGWKNTLKSTQQQSPAASSGATSGDTKGGLGDILKANPKMGLDEASTGYLTNPTQDLKQNLDYTLDIKQYKADDYNPSHDFTPVEFTNF